MDKDLYRKRREDGFRGQTPVTDKDYLHEAKSRIKKAPRDGKGNVKIDKGIQAMIEGHSRIIETHDGANRKERREIMRENGLFKKDKPRFRKVAGKSQKQTVRY